MLRNMHGNAVTKYYRGFLKVELELVRKLRLTDLFREMGNVLWTIVNIFVLIFIGWPVALFCAGFYITLAPFGACISKFIS